MSGDTKVVFTDVCVECVLLGAYMKVTAQGSPADVIAALKEQDADVKFKDSFPVYGKGGYGGGSRSTKSAKIVSITVKSIAGGAKFIDLACQSDDGDLAVAVSKKKIDDFLAGVKDHLDEKNVQKLNQPQATILLIQESQQIAVNYFEIDGKCYFDSFGG